MRFRQAFEVHSTQKLVKIYNNYLNGWRSGNCQMSLLASIYRTAILASFLLYFMRLNMRSQRVVQSPGTALKKHFHVFKAIKTILAINGAKISSVVNNPQQQSPLLKNSEAVRMSDTISAATKTTLHIKNITSSHIRRYIDLLS